MRFIAHRGNTVGPNESLENNPDYVVNALKSGFDAEVDLRFRLEKMYLGHDEPQYEINKEWLFLHSSSLWVHCKDSASLDFCINNGIHCFFHDIDAYTITSKGFVWAYPGVDIASNLCISVMPERKEGLAGLQFKKYYGTCSDYVRELEENYEPTPLAP